MADLFNQHEEFIDSEVSNFSNPINCGLNETTLSDDMVISAVANACAFFGIPEVPVVNAQGTCVWPNDSSTYEDDVFGFNREQLMSLGVSGEDSLTLIYTHECAHRTLQSTFTDDWEEELACDFFAGVHAGMKGMNIDNFEASLGQTPGGDSHPNGALRADFIEYGKQIAEDMQNRGVEITYEGCIARLNQHLEDKGGLIAEYRDRFCSEGIIETEYRHIDKGAKGATMADVEWYEHQARISSGSEQAHWIKEAQWARDHLSSLVADYANSDNGHEGDAKGLTESEIKSKISAAEARIRYAQSQIRSHTELLKNSNYPETERMHIKDAERDLEKAQNELNKWRYTKPTK